MASSVFPFLMGIATAAAIAAGFAATHVDMRSKPVDRIAHTMAVLPQPALPVRAAAVPTTSGWAPPVIPIEETLDRHAPDQPGARPAAPAKPDVKQPPKPVKKVKRDTRQRDAERARAQAYGYHAFGADEFRSTQRGERQFGWR